MASKDKLLTLVTMGVLRKDGATVGNEAKGGSNISSRSVKDASLAKFNYKGQEDSIIIEIECAIYRKVGKGTQKTHYHSHIAVGNKLKAQTNLTFHQHLMSMSHNNTWN